MTEYNEQKRIFEIELSKYTDYVNFSEIYEAKRRMRECGEILDEDIPIFVNFASYVGSLFRISYYKYVHKHDFDVRALADASVIILMFHDVYRFEFESRIRSKLVKYSIEATRYPGWTKFGLLGGSTGELVKMGESFTEYMCELEATE